MNGRSAEQGSADGEGSYTQSCPLANKPVSISLPVRASSASKEEAAVSVTGRVSARVPRITRDYASRLGQRLAYSQLLYTVHNKLLTWPKRPPCHHRPICCTRCLLSVRSQIDDSLYSFPGCTFSLRSTSPGLTCLRAGLSFFFVTSPAMVDVVGIVIWSTAKVKS